MNSSLPSARAILNILLILVINNLKSLFNRDTFCLGCVWACVGTRFTFFCRFTFLLLHFVEFRLSHFYQLLRPPIHNWGLLKKKSKLSEPFTVNVSLNYKMNLYSLFHSNAFIEFSFILSLIVLACRWSSWKKSIIDPAAGVSNNKELSRWIRQSSTTAQVLWIDKKINRIAVGNMKYEIARNW